MMQQNNGQPPVAPAQGAPEKRGRGEPKHRGRAKKIARGYLMIVGGATTTYVLIRLIAWLFVEIGKRFPTTPVM